MGHRVKSAWTALAVTAALAVLVVFLNVLMASAQSGIVVVSNSPGDFPGLPVFSSLQAAIDALYKYDADTVLVDAKGSPWPAELTLSGDITLLGNPANRPWEVILQAAALYRLYSTGVSEALYSTAVIDVVYGPVTIDGLTIEGGLGGILSTGDISVRRCYIRRNKAYGLKVLHAAASIYSSSIVYNIYNAYNIYAAEAVYANYGNGIELWQGANADIIFCSIIENDGNGILVDGSFANVINTLAVYNGVYSTRAGSLIYDTGVGFLAQNYARINALYNSLSGNGSGPADNVSVDGTSMIIPADGDNVAPVPPSFFAPLIWTGKLASDAYQIDRGTLDVVPVGAQGLDFEGELRIVGEPDIGADEYQVGFGTQLIWYFCEVIPNPAGRGTRPSFEFWVRPVDLVPPGSLSAYFVPQGWQNQDPDRIIINLDNPSSSIGIFTGTSSEQIDTWVYGQVTDGHAVVYLALYDTPLQDNQIVGQARIGRHFLIDTIAPRLDVGVGGYGAQYFTELLDPPPGPFAAGSAVLGTYPEHPYPSALPAGWPPWVVSSPPEGPSNTGMIEIPRNRVGPQVLFNVGSLANEVFYDEGADTFYRNFWLPNRSLNLQVLAQFIDPPVTDAAGNPILGEDQFTSLDNRQVSGFSAVDVQGAAENVLGAEPFEWVFEAGDGLLASLNVSLDVTIDEALGVNPGFDFVLGAGTFDPENNLAYVDWTFMEPSIGAGIPWMRAWQNAPFHLAVRFKATDAAGNTTADRFLLDPLHIWWLLNTRTVIDPNREGTTVQFPSFSWRLDRGFNPNLGASLQPVFTYRFWQREGLAEHKPEGLDEPFYPITQGEFPGLVGDSGWPEWSPDGWSEWSYRRALPARFFDRTGFLEELSGHWLLLVVAGGDEAGNIELWPCTELFLDQGTQQVTVFGESGRNWQRFYISGTQAPETEVNAFFWHNRILPSPNRRVDLREASFGSATIIPFPADPNTHRVEARFRITLSGELADLDDDGLHDVKVLWELVKNGNEADRLVSTFPDPEGTNSITVLIPFDLGPILGSPRVSVNYLFRATAFLDDPFSGTVGQFDAGESIDPTPANVLFTVVPGSVGAFVDPKDSPDDQPIKLQEER